MSFKRIPGPLHGARGPFSRTLGSFKTPLRALQPTTLQPTASQPTTLQPTTLQPTTLQPTSLQPTTLQSTSLHFATNHVATNLVATNFVGLLGHCLATCGPVYKLDRVVPLSRNNKNIAMGSGGRVFRDAPKLSPAGSFERILVSFERALGSFEKTPGFCKRTCPEPRRPLPKGAAPRDFSILIAREPPPGRQHKNAADPRAAVF